MASKAVFVFDLLILSYFREFVDCKVRFVKDQKMDAVFPPVIKLDSLGGTPTGNLRPLGYQRQTSGAILEFQSMPDPKEFYYQYVQGSRPVKMEGALKEAPVLKLWENDDYLKDKYGKLNITVTQKQPHRKDFVQHTHEVMKMKKFLVDYNHEDWYLASIVPAEMMEELPLPSCLSCGTLSKFLQMAELWMSSGGTISRLHSHEDHNLHCVLFGRRDFIFIDHQYKVNFAWIPKYDSSIEGFSPLNMEMINVHKYPGISNTPWTYATARQGDCIFVPAGYLHQVRSYGRSISFTILFSPVGEFSDLDCEDDEQMTIRPLSQASFIWSYVDGHKQLTNWRLTPESLRHHLLALVRNQVTLSFQEFKTFYDDAMNISSIHPPAEEVFDFLVSQGQRALSRADVIALTPERLQKVADVLNAPHRNKPTPRVNSGHNHHDHHDL